MIVAAARDLRPRAEHAARQGHERREGPAVRQHRPARRDDPDHDVHPRLHRLRDRHVPRPEGRHGPAGRPGDPGSHAVPDRLAERHLGRSCSFWRSSGPPSCSPATAPAAARGPNPIAKPSGSVLPVQVIGQEWEFTYRYPTYGGVETAQLVLPVGREIEFHVTSLDVIHSFWAYELGVKADANPGVDNVAFVKPSKVGTFQIRCAELCGLWHGYMFDTGKVVTAAAVRELDQAASARTSRRSRSTCPPTARPTPPTRSSAPDDALSRLLPVQPADGRRARRRRLLPRLVARPPDHEPEHRLLRRHRPERHRAVHRLLRRRDRLPRRARLPQLSGAADARPPAVAAREGGGGLEPLLRALHRPQGRRHPVPDRDRRLHLHRRPERDAHPVRAAAPDAPRVERQQLPDARRDPRHDDDGDDDERHPRAVRQLPRAADDRCAPHGVPADRGAHVLAADGRRHDPDDVARLRRLPDRLDGLRAAQRAGEHGHRRVHRVLRARRRLDDAARAEHARRR